jgi:single-strand DNA-binding protein
MTMARANLAGTIEFAPEKRFTPTNVAVTVFTVRVPSPPRVAKNPQSAGAPQEDMLVRVNCWRNLADQVATLQKGQVVLLEGRLIINSFTTQDGQPRKQFELEANQVMLLPGLPQPIEVGAVASAPAPMAHSPQQAPLPGGGGYGGGSASPAAANTGAPQTYAVGLSDLSAEEFMTEDDIPF